MNRCLLIMLLLVASIAPGAHAQRRPVDPQTPAATAGLKRYETRYYILHTDLSEDEAREAAVRMTKMAEEYADRTRDFGGTIRQKFDFYLFRNKEDYHASGGPRGSAGVFDGRSLKAIAGEKLTDQTWHTVQHEGFHQFAHYVIGNVNMPIWVNEGLAEYFGEAIFTGDGFVSGHMPGWRVRRIKAAMQAGRFKTVEDMMLLSHQQWNAELNIANYDQAWAMVQFLAHAEDGRYQRAFAGFMVRIGRGVPWQNAWRETFGDAVGFEDRLREFWLALDNEPSADLYARATVLQLTSLLARATSQKQTFENFDAFIRAVEANEIQMHPEDWLPHSLNQSAIRGAARLAKAGATLELASGKPGIVLTQPDSTEKLTGVFTLRGTRVAEVRIDTPRPPRRAR